MQRFKSGSVLAALVLVGMVYSTTNFSIAGNPPEVQPASAKPHTKVVQTSTTHTNNASVNKTAKAPVNGTSVNDTTVDKVHAEQTPASKATAEVPATRSGYSDERTLKFPGDTNDGALLVIDSRQRSLHHMRWRAGAKGTVTLEVPLDRLLMFQLNQKILLQPSLIDRLPFAGIDVVQFTFMSMDTSEDGTCDRAIKHASHFSDCQYLSVVNSDCSDSGIDQIKAMPKLKGIWAMSSAIRGRCLKNLNRFPLLEELDFGKCAPFDQSQLIYLKKLSGLKHLYMEYTDLKNESIKTISNCKTLETLDIRGSKKLDDSCLPYIASLKNLTSLSLHDTSISIRGLKAISNLKLKHLLLPNKNHGPEDILYLKKLFPLAKFSSKVDTIPQDQIDAIDDVHVMAPLRHH